MNCRRNTDFFTYYTSHDLIAGRFKGERGRDWKGEGEEGRNALRQDGKISANADCFNCSSAPFMYFTLTPTTLPSPERVFLSLPIPLRLSFTMILYYSGQFLRVLGGSKEITAGYPIYLLHGGKRAL